MKPSASFVLILGALASCSTPPPHHATLRDVDVTGARPAPRTKTNATPNNSEDIRRAYLDYLKYAAKDDKSRVDALYRLAQLEFQLNEARNKDAGKDGSAPPPPRDDASLDRNIEILQTVLRDYPKAANGDKTMYQLARAYDQKGLSDRSIETLQALVKQYPKSPYYAESQFRLGEYAFIHGNYSQAEDLYTDVLVTRNNGIFREKARYKRGWARFKQNFYREAVDDFADVISMNNFDNLAKASTAEKNTFEEYFRALGLSFIYQGGAETLQQYFREKPDFRYIPQTYLRVSDLYLADERYADAASTLEQFIKTYPQSPLLAEAAQKKVEIWAASGFRGNFARALDDLYTGYHPQSSYWTRPGIATDARARVVAALRTYILLASSRAHQDYREHKKEEDFNTARTWYDRYLKDYQSYSRKDNIYFLYAELLSLHKNYAEALALYQKAAYDGEIIVNKDSAYATVLMATRLHQSQSDPRLRTEYLDKLIQSSLQYVRLYPDDTKSVPVMTHAAEEAYREGRFAQAVELCESIPSVPYTTEAYNLHSLKAHSYFKLMRYRDAENGYQALLAHYKPDAKTRSQIEDNLALSIYNQATAARDKKDMPEATRQFLRMSELAPHSEHSATGLYEAITLAFDAKQWNAVASYIEKFQKLYPSHKLSHDVSKKLSVAYLNTNQEGAAASALVQAARSDDSVEYRTAALWKAAELYIARKDSTAAIKTLEEYVLKYEQPYPQYLEGMYQLSELYGQRKDDARANQWRNRVLDAEKRAGADMKTDRTNFIGANAALALARQERTRFDNIRLVLPLNRSLALKKDALQKTLALYGRAASYGLAESATESTCAIGDVYYAFSRALLDSERPRNLSAAEQAQYKILLEDQAFPFEDNAIKFYEKDLAYSRQGIANDWTNRSLAQLKVLFPARYNREPLLESYINVLH